MSISDASASPQDAPRGLLGIFRALMLCSAYIAISTVLIRFNKAMMAEDHFPFSLALAAIHMLMSTICCTVIYIFAPSLMPKMAETHGQRLELMKWFVPIGVCFSVMLYGSNEAYLYCSVTFLQFMKEANVLIVFFISCCVGLQVLNRCRAFVLLCVILGASISVSGDMSFSMVGFGLQAISQCAECMRIVMGEIVLSGPRKLDPLTYTMFAAPASFVVLIIANLFHWDPMTWTRLVEWWPLLLVNASIAFALNVTGATIVKEISAVGFVLTGLMKDMVIVGLSAMYFGEHVTHMQWAAFAITISGIFFWSLMKINPQAAPVQALERLLCVPTSDKEQETLEEKTPLLDKKDNAGIKNV